MPTRSARQRSPANTGVPNRVALRVALGASFALAFSACGTNPYYDPAKPYAADGFHNRYPHAEKGSFWKWKLEQWRNGLPVTPPDGWHFEELRPDVAFLQANRSIDTLTWIGHASFLLQLGGLNILT